MNLWSRTSAHRIMSGVFFSTKVGKESNTEEDTEEERSLESESKSERRKRKREREREGGSVQRERGGRGGRAVGRAGARERAGKRASEGENVVCARAGARGCVGNHCAGARRCVGNHCALDTCVRHHLCARDALVTPRGCARVCRQSFAIIILGALDTPACASRSLSSSPSKVSSGDLR